ncbi:MAG: hypothetical protein CMM56_01660 [Rhodospirillaceae bacterium]|nr:hypothetical protein [Rhodospirillaceae bacterium]|tara:strand:+ start:3243 stop:3839 length:597 start_codon:yes stop_codon:yes gene_type:complete
MAYSIHNLGFALTLLIIPVLVLSQQVSAPLPISLDADSSSFDRDSNAVVFNGLRIAQGDLTIESDRAEATGLNFEMSNWIFEGNVRIAIDSANITSSNATLSFQDHELHIVKLQGNPATFEDFSATREESIIGGATSLEYDNRERTLHMIGGAWLNEGPNQFRGCDLIYDIDEEQITSGSSECGEPLVITILPPSEEQ